MDDCPPAISERRHEIDYLPCTPSYAHFLEFYLTPLRPCLISMPEILSWRASKEWLKYPGDDETVVPDIDSLEQSFGDARVEVAFCDELDECGGQRREQMTFSAYATLWRRNPHSSIYMKDFHFCLAGQSSAYRTPDVFADDWLNSYTISNSPEGVKDDFRFVYLGQDGTKTNFHRDVYASHSWSCSLSGIKRWRLVPPEYTHLVRDEKSGDMPAELFGECVELDFPLIGKAREAILTVWQFPGEGIFVPSGWLHEVKNFGDTLSVNHNWANASCLARMASALAEEVRIGASALDGFDLGSPAEVAVLVQDLTKRNFGWGWKEFFEMIRWRYVVQQQQGLASEIEYGWPEAPSELRPPVETEKEIVSKVVNDWLVGDGRETSILPEVRRVAEEILGLLHG